MKGIEMEKQKQKKTLEFKRQVIRQLRSAEAEAVAGGMRLESQSCPGGPESVCPQMF
jgi:hypothetical protein